MKEEYNIKLESIIAHILDTNLEIPVLSENEHPIGSEIAEFVENHIQKVLNDDSVKSAEFKNRENRIRELCEKIKNEKEKFAKYSADIAVIIHEIMYKYPGIPSGDLICSLFSLDGIEHLGMLKLNYKTVYTHSVSADENGTLNLIVKQNYILPGDSQKVDEAVIINLEDYSIRILEKKYEVNGEDKFYISTMLLETDCELSNKEKAKIFKKASESFSKKHFVDEVETSQKLSRAITEGIENRETIDVTEVAEHVFKENDELKQSFMEHVERVGLKDKRIEIDMEAAQKVFKKHRIKTDEGIEISIPYEYYMDKDKLEVIKNSDGTVSILIKNVNRVTSQ
jgi:hypothetical protein